ncbi:MAG TPA: DUF1998 domain-containing protein, partial [Spirochaetia bacterium]|nr:DUF1998 domain-containing protein [Spirochaetia bacterium]
PGGTGLAEGFVEKLKLILSAARDLVVGCECESGCPSCIGAAAGGTELVGVDGKPCNRKLVVAEFLSEWVRSGVG